MTAGDGCSKPARGCSHLRWDPDPKSPFGSTPHAFLSRCHPSFHLLFLVGKYFCDGEALAGYMGPFTLVHLRFYVKATSYGDEYREIKCCNPSSTICLLEFVSTVLELCGSYCPGC